MIGTMLVVVGRDRDRLNPPLLAVAQARVSFLHDLPDLGDEVPPAASLAAHLGSGRRRVPGTGLSRRDRGADEAALGARGFRRLERG